MRFLTKSALLLTLGAGLTGCGGGGESKAPEQTADAAWEEINTSGARPARNANEDSLTYFMRNVELSDQRRRDLGLKFWEKHPTDARRYKWLVLTVNMPPHYPKDINEWAKNETLLETNKAAVDTAAQEEWAKKYAVLREAFWNATEVTPQEKRFL